jgi:hypothetical protein
MCQLSLALSGLAGVPASHPMLLLYMLHPADIQPGQGLVQTANQTWQAVNCSSGANYGVAERTYNLTANPCR